MIAGGLSMMAFQQREVRVRAGDHRQLLQVRRIQLRHCQLRRQGAQGITQARQVAGPHVRRPIRARIRSISPIQLRLQLSKQ